MSESTHPPIRVFIADDHPIVRAGVSGMLGKAPGLCVVGETGDGAQVEGLAVAAGADVLVLDVNMPGLDPIGVTRRLTGQSRRVQVLILSAYADEAYVTGLLSAGATGYVLKDEALDSLVHAIRAVARGETWLSQRVAGQLVRKVASHQFAGEAEEITAREREVLRLLALGYANHEIADKLFITKRTVQNHVSSIYARLQLQSRAEAVLYAIRNGIVDVSEVKSS